MATRGAMIRLVARIVDAWEKVPELRLGQLVANAHWPQDLFYLSDEDLVERIENWAETHKAEENK